MLKECQRILRETYLVQDTDSFQEDNLHMLIMLTPPSDDNRIEPRIQIISRYVAWRFCQMAERTQWFQTPQLFMNFEGNASAPCFRGFECFVFCKFMEGLNFNIFPL